MLYKVQPALGGKKYQSVVWRPKYNYSTRQSEGVPTLLEIIKAAKKEFPRTQLKNLEVMGGDNAIYLRRKQ